MAGETLPDSVPLPAVATAGTASAPAPDQPSPPSDGSAAGSSSTGEPEPPAATTPVLPVTKVPETPPKEAGNGGGRSVPAGGVHAPSDSTESGTPATVTQLHIAVTEDSTVPVKVTVHPMVAAYKADLERIGKAQSRAGLQVIEMAEKLVSSATSPAAAANLSKELERLMASVEADTVDAKVSMDPSLIIRDRTLAKLRAVEGGTAVSA